MITETLESTKKATFTVLIPHPDPRFKGFPTPNGTCFFISEEGFFLPDMFLKQFKIFQK